MYGQVHDRGSIALFDELDEPGSLRRQTPPHGRRILKRDSGFGSDGFSAVELSSGFMRSRKEPLNSVGANVDLICHLLASTTDTLPPQTC